MHSPGSSQSAAAGSYLGRRLLGCFSFARVGARIFAVMRNLAPPNSIHCVRRRRQQRTHTHTHNAIAQSNRSRVHKKKPFDSVCWVCFGLLSLLLSAAALRGTRIGQQQRAANEQVRPPSQQLQSTERPLGPCGSPEKLRRRGGSSREAARPRRETRPRQIDTHGRRAGTSNSGAPPAMMPPRAPESCNLLASRQF